jgi:catechol 2,3-dioxygenase-like lactoylglutathione lyase family enzyme
VERFYNDMKTKLDFYGRPGSITIRGRDNYQFVYCRDPESNLIEFVSGSNIISSGMPGAVRSVGISVSDMNRSISFYTKLLGIDEVVIDTHDDFSGLVDEVSGKKKTQVHSCLLATTNGEMIELFEVYQPRGRSIPFGTNWGDFGYLQLCFSCDDVSGVASICMQGGIESLCKIETMPGPRSPSFVYLKDPDGIPIEMLGFSKT